MKALSFAKPRTAAVCLVVALVIGSAAVGCATPAKGEAASLVSAVDRFRRAEFVGKPALLEPLRAVACTDHDVCAAKDACVEHAEAMVKAITMKTEVQLKLEGADASTIDPATRVALLEKLDEATRLLNEGRAAQAACDQKTLELKMKYRL